MRLLAVIGLCVAVFSTPAMPDDLNDAAGVCSRHQGSRVGPVSQQQIWQPGWEHCSGIVKAKNDRDEAIRNSDENSNPDLKATRDLARRLGGK